jgi:CheY-like chemotaxis protein
MLNREDANAVIRVRDTGVGLTRTMLDKIFDPFVQVDETLDRSAGGIGVGLSLVRSIVESHDGNIQVASDGLGQGSEFVVRIPLADASNPPIVTESSSMPKETLTPTTAASDPLRLLVVEDDSDLRNTLVSILELDGYQVQSVGDGPSALAALNQGAFDFAIIDIGLPGMDGYELAKRVRARPEWATTHLIALTGYGQTMDLVAARTAGFDTHLTKPFDPAALAAVLTSS